MWYDKSLWASSLSEILVIIYLANDLLPVWYQAHTWTNDDLSIVSLWIKFSQIGILSL